MLHMVDVKLIVGLYHHKLDRRAKKKTAPLPNCLVHFAISQKIILVLYFRPYIHIPCFLPNQMIVKYYLVIHWKDYNIVFCIVCHCYFSCPLGNFSCSPSSSSSSSFTIQQMITCLEQELFHSSTPLESYWDTLTLEGQICQAIHAVSKTLFFVND